MSVMDMNSRMAMAEKLSVPQLQQAIQSGSIPAYIGIPLIEQKNKERSQMAAAQQGQQKPPSVVSQILQQSDQQEQQERGIDELPSNLPMMEDEEMGMANGGIVAFSGEGPSLVEDRRSPSDRALDAVIARLNSSQNNNRIIPPATNTGEAGGITELFPVDIGVSPEFGGTSSEDPRSFAPGAFSEGRRDRVKAEKQAEEEARRQAFLRQSAPQLAAQSNFGMGDMDATAGRTYTPTPKGAGDVGTGRVNPNAPAPAGGNVANIPLTTNEIRSQAAAGKGSMLDQYAEMLMKEREGSAASRKDAKAMALFQAGLGIMGGTSPNAFANIAQGALPATQAYQQELKGIRAEDRDRIKQLMELGVSKEKLGLEARKLGISEKRFEQMYEIEKQKLGVMGGQRSDLAAERAELARERRVDTMFKNIQGTPWAIGRTPAEILRAAQEAVNAGRDVQETPAAPSGVTVRRIS